MKYSGHRNIIWKQQFGVYMFKLFRPQLVIVGPHFSLLLILTSVSSWTVLKPAKITLWSWKCEAWIVLGWDKDTDSRRRHSQAPVPFLESASLGGHAYLVHCNFLWMNPHGHKRQTGGRTAQTCVMILTSLWPEHSRLKNWRHNYLHIDRQPNHHFLQLS